MISTLSQRLREHLAAVYGDATSDEALDGWVDRLLDAAQLSATQSPPPAHRNLWDETDVAVITYGDSLLNGEEAPLKTLHGFLTQRLGALVSWVHVLPFHPWTSDDGFAVLDYSSVNEALGTWSDITRLGVDYRLMADLVLNHCSSRSAWFENFRKGEAPGDDYFFACLLYTSPSPRD